MSHTHDLRPWTRVAVPHADILHGDFDMSSYAANLGQVDICAERCPEVYKQPVAFFHATYRTAALDELLQGVARVLSGEPGNRVLQLRTPFGGGKTHTLIALLHLCRHRAALDAAELLDGYPNPGSTRVAVLPCLDLSAPSGRVHAETGIRVRTLWGELAVRLGGAEAYEIVREADERRVNPGGDQLRQILDGPPTLLLLDEVLTYVEAALGEPVGDTNLGRQTMLFLQFLTEVVRGLPHCAMVYSLQQSVREAVGDEGLLQQLDSLVSRIDAKKEPVTGDEVLRVVQRRLFQELGDPKVREAVATEYASMLEDWLAQNATSDGEQRAAADQAALLRERILDAYPFHPELLDLMYHRWGSLPTYQRTRGALQFLATVVGALWKKGEAAGPLIGPGDVLLEDHNVRQTFFSQVGEREAMKSVLDSDVTGSGARCRRVDDSIASEVPAYHSFRVGTRLARSIVLYSFGAKPGEDRGVLKQDLLAAAQVPGLPADVLDVALQGLTETLLYIHGTGRRYRFEKKPNLNKLLDDEARKFQPHEVLEAVRKHFESKIGAPGGYVLWPADHGRILDRKPRFQVVFLGAEHTLLTSEAQVALALEWSERCGAARRQYRNALAFALPDAAALENARAAARRMLAAGALLEDRRRHGFDDEDAEELKRRRSRAEVDLTAAARVMYPTLLLPVAAPPDAPSPVRIERFDIQSYHALGAGLMRTIHEELKNWVFPFAVPGKLASACSLGSGELGSRGHWIPGPELVDQFFGSVVFPKLLTLEGLRDTVARGVSRGTFGYVMGAAEIDGTLSVQGRECLTWRQSVTRDDIDLSRGSHVISADYAQQIDTSFRQPDPTPVDPALLPAPLTPPVLVSDGDPILTPPIVPSPVTPPPVTTGLREVRLQFRADAVQLFQSFVALQNLAEMADEQFAASVHIYARASKPMDRNKYEMEVVMPLEEADVEVQKS